MKTPVEEIEEERQLLTELEVEAQDGDAYTLGFACRILLLIARALVERLPL